MLGRASHTSDLDEPFKRAVIGAGVPTPTLGKRLTARCGEDVDRRVSVDVALPSFDPEVDLAGGDTSATCLKPFFAALFHVVYSLLLMMWQGEQSRPAFCLFRLKRDFVVYFTNTAAIRSASGRARRGARLGFGNVLRVAGRANGGNPIALDNLAGPFPIRH